MSPFRIIEIAILQNALIVIDRAWAGVGLVRQRDTDRRRHDPRRQGRLAPDDPVVEIFQAALHVRDRPGVHRRIGLQQEGARPVGPVEGRAVVLRIVDIEADVEYVRVPRRLLGSRGQVVPSTC